MTSRNHREGRASYDRSAAMSTMSGSRHTAPTMPDRPVPDPIETVRSFAAYATNLDEMFGYFARDAVWEGVPLGITFRGIAEIRGFLTDWVSSYDEYVIEAQEVLDFGGGVVLALVHQLVRPAGGAIDARVREDWAFVFVWADGQVVRVEAHQDLDQARAAAERLAEERA